MTSFAARAQSFGLEDDAPWALPALRLLYSAPRIFLPLAQSWDTQYPGTLKALRTMQEQGLVAEQDAVVVDTIKSRTTNKVGRPVKRFRLSAKGDRMLVAASSDVRVLRDSYPRISEGNTSAVLSLLAFFAVTDSTRHTGYSLQHAAFVVNMEVELVKWWVRKWLQDKVLKELQVKLADVREVIPGHFRARRGLSTQLKVAIKEYPRWAGLTAQFRLQRSTYLEDISPARIGSNGATDYDHDVTAQRILGGFTTSGNVLTSSLFSIEPRFKLLTTTVSPGKVHISHTGKGRVFYQPDALFRERDESGVTRTVLEYERFQSRRDAWSHIERFLGYIHTHQTTGERSVLRFVVDTRTRERGYVELCEAFSDYYLDFPEFLPQQETSLMVSSAQRLSQVPDPLNPARWFKVPLTAGRADPDSGSTLLHTGKGGAYDLYFAT